MIVYHHLGMHMSAKGQIDVWRRGLESALPSEVLGGMFVLRYHRGTGRLYFMIPRREHRDALDVAARELLAGPWGSEGHFTDAS